ncbi:MAG: threonine synthase [Alphaproteobacteria bacterium]|nr:threonine synthase [Alphaproteobacteria bacterium]
MRYYSTRHHSNSPHQALHFDDVVLKGLADDGGLYLPETWPHFSEAKWQSLAPLPYHQLAAEVIKPFIGNVFSDDELAALTQKSYRDFRHQAIAPLKQLDNQLFVMELFHGPTLAFKDFALQFLGNLFDAILEKRNQTINIIGATSGDTGSAAICAVAGKHNQRIFMLHPKGKVSKVQEAQMTSMLNDNVYNIAIDGSFDDCQNIVKSLFADHDFRDGLNLCAVNSINWARIMAQIVYYAYGSLRLGLRDIAVSVPSGNFGNIFAAWAAKQMGLPIQKLIIGSNCNDILARTVQSGIMQTSPVIPSVAPSMDIQISSNFERLLYELLGRDGAMLETLMHQFKQTGRLDLPDNAKKSLQTLFCAHAMSDDEIRADINKTYQQTGEIIDPHSMIGVTAAKLYGGDLPVMAIATAHPAKFPNTITQAINIEPTLPDYLSDLMQRPTRCHDVMNDADSVKQFITQNQ